MTGLLKNQISLFICVSYCHIFSSVLFFFLSDLLVSISLPLKCIFLSQVNPFFVGQKNSFCSRLLEYQIILQTTYFSIHLCFYTAVGKTEVSTHRYISPHTQAMAGSAKSGPSNSGNPTNPTNPTNPNKSQLIQVSL